MRLVAIRRERGRYRAVGELDTGLRSITPRRAVEAAFEHFRLQVGDRVTLGNGQTWEITRKAARRLKERARSRRGIRGAPASNYKLARGDR